MHGVDKGQSQQHSNSHALSHVVSLFSFISTINGHSPQVAFIPPFLHICSSFRCPLFNSTMTRFLCSSCKLHLNRSILCTTPLPSNVETARDPKLLNPS